MSMKDYKEAPPINLSDGIRAGVSDTSSSHTMTTPDTRCTNPKCTNKRCVGCIAFTPKNTPDTEWEKEKLAEQLHEWYLEATYQEDAKYNIDAVVPYNDLPEGSKILDRYIAGKIIEMFTSRDTYWKERVEKVICDNCHHYARYKRTPITNEDNLK